MAETVKTAQQVPSRATRELARRVIALFSLARAARDCAMPQSVEARLRGALWGLFAGDALAAPTHWYYGGIRQIEADYGRGGIKGYTKPRGNLTGSIMNKSNLNGGGRGRWESGRTVIGDIINHGKKDLWHPSKSVHYHATLSAGENTLEARLCRVLMRVVAARGGAFDADAFRDAYVEFMTMPGSHNDAYASTCHRMFFANREHGRALRDCPDNDGHNVDTIDGLVLPTVVALASAARGAAPEARRADAAACAAVTRASPTLESAAAAWSDVLARVVGGESTAAVVEETADVLGLGAPALRSLAAGPDPVVS